MKYGAWCRDGCAEWARPSGAGMTLAGGGYENGPRFSGGRRHREASPGSTLVRTRDDGPHGVAIEIEGKVKSAGLIRCVRHGSSEVIVQLEMILAVDAKEAEPHPCRVRAPPRYDAKSPSRRVTGGAGAIEPYWRSCSTLPTRKESVVVIARKENGSAEGELVERHGKQRCIAHGGCQSLTLTKCALIETLEPARPPEAVSRSSALSPAIASTERTTPRENMSAGRRMILSPSTL